MSRLRTTITPVSEVLPQASLRAFGVALRFGRGIPCPVQAAVEALTTPSLSAAITSPLAPGLAHRRALNDHTGHIGCF